MKKQKGRYEFKCWNCKQNYTLFREITEAQTLFVACPYCNAEAVVDLAPYLKQKKVIVRGDNQTEQTLGEELELPPVLPTQKAE